MPPHALGLLEGLVVLVALVALVALVELVALVALAALVLGRHGQVFWDEWSSIPCHGNPKIVAIKLTKKNMKYENALMEYTIQFPTMAYMV